MTRTPRIAAMAAKVASASKSAPPAPVAAGPEGSRSVSRLDLATQLAEKMDMSRAKATEAVDAVLGAIGEALKSGQEVRLTGFGTFATAQRKATTGRNPRTGEEIQIAASTSVKFKPGKALKDSLG